MSDPLEPIDIVDEDNKIISQATKKEAHEKGLLHRTVIGEVVNSKGDYILVKQSSDRQDAGQFVSPVGGHVQAGETEIDALFRETLEEIGIQQFEYKLIGRAIFNRFVIGRQENHYFILYEIYTDQDFILGNEADDYQAFAKDVLKKALKDHPEQFGDAYHFVVKTFYPELLV